jgi:hypothetical protein
MNDIAVRTALCQSVELSARLLVINQGIAEMTGVCLLPDRRQHGIQGVLDRAEQAEMERAAIAERFRPHIDLRDLRALRIERPVRKIRTEHQECVAVLHRGVTRRKADETGHPHVVGIVVFDEFLATEGMHDRRLQFSRQLDDLCMSACTSCAAEQCHP